MDSQVLQRLLNTLATSRGYDLGLMNQANPNQLNRLFEELKGIPEYSGFASDYIDPLVGDYGLDKLVPNGKIAFNSAKAMYPTESIDSLMDIISKESGIPITPEDGIGKSWNYGKILPANNTVYNTKALQNFLNYDKLIGEDELIPEYPYGPGYMYKEPTPMSEADILASKLGAMDLNSGEIFDSDLFNLIQYLAKKPR